MENGIVFGSRRTNRSRIAWTIGMEIGFKTISEVVVAPTLEELGLDRLATEDRLAVAEAIWDSVARDVELAPISAVERAELEARLADSLVRPAAVTPWEVIKARALARARQ